MPCAREPGPVAILMRPRAPRLRVNELVHLAAGILIAGAFGLRGKRRLGVALFAILPDWDALTTPLLPFLIEWLEPGRAAGRGLVLALGHGGMSHSLFGMLVLFGIALVVGLRGRALAAAGAALLSHWALDIAVPWDVWFLLPFVTQGWHVGWLALEDTFVTWALGGLALATLAPEAWARMSHRPSSESPWLAPGAAALATVLVLAPFVAQQGMLARYGSVEGASAVGVSYMTFVVIEPRAQNELQLSLVRVGAGVLDTRTVEVMRDNASGHPRAREAMELTARALKDMASANPFSTPLFEARRDDDGRLLVRVQGARETLTVAHFGADQLGMELRYDDELRVTALAITKGGRDAPAPLEALPLWMPIAPE